MNYAKNFAAIKELGTNVCTLCGKHSILDSLLKLCFETLVIHSLLKLCFEVFAVSDSAGNKRASGSGVALNSLYVCWDRDKQICLGNYQILAWFLMLLEPPVREELIYYFRSRELISYKQIYVGARSWYGRCNALGSK
ncbi:hypothetical protein Bca4012_026349 [Brassica carinata]|uniref:Uncharacterized protein n=1 Tax=Brassica carinata TaxID=52824 RepID=A0A8X8AUD5_BRACI|nr:hypothetical protein Bca52824_023414 [Brassica carinata]